MWESNMRTKCGNQVWEPSVGIKLWEPTEGIKCGNRLWEDEEPNWCRFRKLGIGVGTKCGKMKNQFVVDLGH